jgi:hypothetical protein
MQALFSVTLINQYNIFHTICSYANQIMTKTVNLNNRVILLPKYAKMLNKFNGE